MTYELPIEKKFGNHQTFVPKYGWLKKTYDAVAKDPLIFSRENATVALGVGKNMVDSMAYWSEAFRLITPSSSSSKSGPREYRNTAIADFLFDNPGWDPFIENESTLWVLYALAMKAPSQVPSWWLTMNHMVSSDFRVEDLQQLVVDEVNAFGLKVPLKSIQRDIDCMLRTLAPRRRLRKQSLEEALESPLKNLGLIVLSAHDDCDFRFVRGRKANLRPEVVALLCADFMAHLDGGSDSISVRRLATEKGSPGKILGLNEREIAEYLDLWAQNQKSSKLAVSTGTRQLRIDGITEKPQATLNMLLAEVYGIKNHSRIDTDLWPVRRFTAQMPEMELPLGMASVQTTVKKPRAKQVAKA